MFKTCHAPLIASLLLAVGLGGCASLSNLDRSQRRQFVIENEWTRDTVKGDFWGFRRMNRMSPLVVDTMLIEANAIDGLLAFDRKSGRQLWRLNLPNGIEGGVDAAGGKLFFGASDGEFYSVDASNGKVLWTFPVRAETLAAPTVEAGIVYFQSGSDQVYALDAGTGKQLWTYNRLSGGTLSIRATTRPVIAGEAVLVGFSDGYVVSLRKRDGALTWERKLGKAQRFRDVDSTPVVDGKNVYVSSFDAALYSLDLESGAVNWSVEDGGYLPVTIGTGSLADRLFDATANGKILMVDKNTGKVLKTISLKNGIATQPVLYRNMLVYGESEGDLIVASADNGTEIQHFAPGNGLVSKPTILEQSGETYFISNAAVLYALKLEFVRRTDQLPWQRSEVD